MAKHDRAEWADELCSKVVDLESRRDAEIPAATLAVLKAAREILAPYDKAAKAAKTDVAAVERALEKIEGAVAQAYLDGATPPQGWVFTKVLVPRQERWTKASVAALLTHLGFEPAAIMSDAAARGIIGGSDEHIRWEQVKEPRDS